MFKAYKIRPALTVWLAGLVVTGLLVVACGAAEPDAGEATTTAVEAEEAVNTTAQGETSEPEASENEESTADAEEAISKESEVADNETLSASDQELAAAAVATCSTATPQNDPLVAALQPNELLAQASASEWSKGPAGAEVTIVEYADFQ
jgi:hypothetical protein